MILKDGKHYVEGGPKCNKCGGKGETLMPVRGISFPNTFPCEWCYAGCKAVEDWTDAEKAEWLRKNKPHTWNGSIPKYPSIEFRAPKWCVGYYEHMTYRGTWRLIIIEKDPNFSQALTAAVIAVAKEVAE